MEYDGYAITIQVLEGNLYAETDGIDVRASTDRYVYQVRTAIQEAYPGVEVNIDLQRGTQGAAHDPTVTLPDESDRDEERAIAEDVDAIQGGVWESWDWLVYSEPANTPA